MAFLSLRDADRNMKRYAEAVDPRSAHEVLRERIAANLKKQEREELEEQRQKQDKSRKSASKPKARRSNRQGPGEAFFKSMARSLGTAIGGTAGRKFLRGWAHC